jgi:hypothetical protein
MIKIRHIASMVAAGALVLSTASASAAGFASWPSVRHAGRSYAYWGPRGVHVGRWQPGRYGAWWPGKYAGGAYYRPGVYYGCANCGGYYNDDHHNDNALWYGLGVATPLLLQGLSNYEHNY